MAKFEQTYNTHGIVYGYKLNSKKWEFTNGRFTFLASVVGGKANAAKVAGFVAGGLKRNNGERLDNLARANIEKFVKY
jgi:hypothetical protein